MFKYILLFFLLLSITHISYSQCVPKPGTEAVKDGGFEAGGNSSTYGQHSVYTPAPGGHSDPGLYYIGADPKTFNTGFPKSFPPHTGTKMLMVDAAKANPSIFWEQKVDVIQGQTYYFSAWITSLALAAGVDTAKLQFEVKGANETAWTVLGSSIKPPDPGDWKQIFETWNSGTNTIAFLRLSADVASGDGNDFAIDDLSFINSCSKVNNGPKPELGPAIISLCNNGGSIDLDSKVANTPPNDFTWYKDNVLLVSKQPALTNITQTGTYTVCVDSNSCLNQDTIKVVATLFIDLGPDTKLCNPATKVLNTGITASNSFQITWKKDGVVIPDSTGTSFVANGPGTYRVEVTDIAGGNCNGFDEIVITSDLAVPNNFTFCPTTNPNQTFTVSGTGKYKWWIAATGGTAVGTGNSYTANGLAGTTTFYVEDTTKVPAFAGLKDDGNTGKGSGPNNDENAVKIEFLANEDCTLDTILAKFVFNTTNSGNATAKMVDLGDQSVQTKIIPIINSTVGRFYHTIPLNFHLKAGHRYKISIIGSGDWGAIYYNNDLPIVYPVDYGPVKFLQGLSPATYGNLFDWKLSLSSKCARMPVTATEDCPINCTPPLNTTLTAGGPTSVCKGSSFNQVVTGSVSNAGAATYQYEFFRNNISIQAASATTTYTVVQDGAYKVVVSDVANPSKCKATSNIINFTIDSLPVLTTTVTHESCAGKADGKIDLKPSGNGPFTFSWNNAAITEDLSGLTGGNYSVTVTDAKNCVQTTSAIVTTLTFTASAAATDVKCNGGNDGSVTLTLSGGIAPVTYLWNNAATTQNLTSVPKGTYNVTATDSKGCTAAASATVNEPAAAVSATVTNKTDVTCHGGTNGSIDITVTGGTPAPGANPYTFLWNNNAVTEDLPAIPAGNYNLTVKDLNNCSTSVAVAITEPAALDLLLTPSNVTCTSQGVIIANGSGGTGVLNYSIDGSSFSASSTFSNLPVGQYTVTVKDANNCIFSKDAVIGSDITLPVITPTKTSVCIGDSAILTATPGASYVWSPGGETTRSIIVADSGKYSVTVTDANGCVATSPEIAITINQPPVNDLGSDTLKVCPNVAVTIGKPAVAGYTYKWTSSTPGFSNTKAMPEVSVSEDTKYLLTVTSKGCNAKDSVILSIEEPSTLYVPNAFTPNNDTKNDVFKAEGVGITSLKGSIFNSWGELLYEWDTKDGVWDGTYMNKPVQEGVYVYNINTRDKCSKVNAVRTGIVSVIR